MAIDKIKLIGTKAHENDKKSGCSQAVLGALQEGLNIGDILSFKAATALVGGIAGRGETCGALIGGLMALGIFEGRERFEDNAKLNTTVTDGLTLSREFMRRIETEYKLINPLPSTLCKDITKAIYGRTWDLTDPAQKAGFFASGGHSDWGCPNVCKIAAEITAEFIIKQSN